MGKRGKIPSLLTGRAGTPKIEIAKRRRNCKHCGSFITAGDACVRVPDPRNQGYNGYCIPCFKSILNQTQDDMRGLQLEIEAY